MHCEVRGIGNKSTRDCRHIKLLKSPAVVASGISNTLFLPSNPDELCNRLTLLLQEHHAGNISSLVNEEFIALVDKLLEHKCMSKKQHKQLLFTCNLLHTKKKVSILVFLIAKCSN